MTLDQEIEHCEKVVSKKWVSGCIECVSEHEQLAEWLKELKAYKERHEGEWIYDELLNNWKCSECGETPKTIGYVGNTDFMKEHFKFCNHCGAKMQKGGAK